jgi:hypothetical protein
MTMFSRQRLLKALLVALTVLNAGVVLAQGLDAACCYIGNTRVCGETCTSNGSLCVCT